MIVSIDVGNTNTVIGLFESSFKSNLLDHWRIRTVSSRSADEWMMVLKNLLELRNQKINQIEAVAIASVVPKVTASFQRIKEKFNLNLYIIDWRTNIGMPILLDQPSEVGADRLANAVAAYSLEETQSVVVDLGTATTFDVVSKAGEYLGGIILPGIEISIDALFARAEALRPIEFIPPQNLIGKSTSEALRSGATYGYVAQIDGLCEQIEKEIGPCRIISTGGLSSAIAPLSKRIQMHDPWLTLQGIRIIYQRMTS